MAQMFDPKGALLAIAAAAALALGGCSSSVKLDERAPVETRPVVSTDAQPAADTNKAAESSVTTVDLAAKGAASGATATALARVVYFDYDSFAVKDEFRPVVEAHAKQLAGQRSKRLTIEGHTDERGGREYNLALGQKRAEAVQKAMVLLGAQADQLEAVSYGEERPAATGATEEAWAKNRRAELKDR